jgi:hypothetical protein
MSDMKKIAIIWQIVCIILNIFGMVVGVVARSVFLVIWCAAWGYFSCCVLDRLREKEDEHAFRD